MGTLICLAILVGLTSGTIFENDGIYIQKRCKVKSIAGFYTVLVSLEHPTPPEIQEPMTRIKTIIRNLEECPTCPSSVNMNDKRIWLVS